MDKTKATTFLAAYETSAPAGQIFNVQSLTKKKCHINALYIYCDLQITLTVHRYISTCAKKKKLVVVGPVLWSGVSTPRVVC